MITHIIFAFFYVTLQCVCSVNTIGGFDAPFGNYTDSNNINFTFSGGF